MTTADILQRLKGARPSGSGWIARCPAHEDVTPSLSVTLGHGGRTLVRCHAGCATEAIVLKLGLEMTDLFVDAQATNGNRHGLQIVASYIYANAGGEPVGRVVRLYPKSFRQAHACPEASDGWGWGLGGRPERCQCPRITLPLYRLHRLAEAVALGKTVFVAEGEKDVEAIERAGGVGTCNSGGAGKWAGAHAVPLTGAHVVIVADKDEPGREHARQVAATLAGLAATIELVQARTGKDASEHLDAGHTLADFEPVGPDDIVDDQPVHESGTFVLDKRTPLATARRLIADRFSDPSGVSLLRAWRGEFRHWNGTHYSQIEDAALRATVYRYSEKAQRMGRNGLEPYRPTAAAVNDVIDAVRAAAHLEGATEPPIWLDGETHPHPREFIACANGLLHVPTRELHPHSPALFNTHALPFDYDANAEEPARFLTFLHTLWPDDDESIQTLQEVFAYMLSGETRLQKMFLLIGPLRAGKGIIARLLSSAMGKENVAGPTLSSLATNFGLQSLIGKPLAIVSDARLSRRPDNAVIVERLLSITGEDLLTVDRKYRDPWIGQLPTRFLMLTNELPRLSDTSGALAGRFVILRFSRSFFGREDTGLFDRLVPELPSIFMWALNGLDRLRQRGRFDTPKASQDAVQELGDLSSPVGAFVRQCCVVEPGAEEDTRIVYSRWRRWCEERGRSHPTNEQVFGRDLRAVVPGLSTASRRQGEARSRVYLGIRMEGS